MKKLFLILSLFTMSAKATDVLWCPSEPGSFSAIGTKRGIEGPCFQVDKESFDLDAAEVVGGQLILNQSKADAAKSERANKSARDQSCKTRLAGIDTAKNIDDLKEAIKCLIP